jgi:serine/threonine-protein phosphatase 6 regulatory ankyrin repeat subunit B
LFKQSTHARGFRAIATIGLLAIAAAVGAAQKHTLADLVREGKRENALAAITPAPQVDVNEKAGDGSTALMWAAYNDDLELVRALLKVGAKANVTSNFGATALSEAIKIGNLQMFRALLDAGADIESPNLDNQTALMLAISSNQPEMAKILIERGANVKAIETFRDQTALMWAAGANQPEIVDLLLAKGANTQVNLRAHADDWERTQTSEPRGQFSSRHTGGLTALLYATRSGCLRCAQSLVDAGADISKPNPDGVTPLLNAADNSRWDIVMYLLDKGANPHVWDMHGRTVLWITVDRKSAGGGGGGFGGGGPGGGRGGAPGAGAPGAGRGGNPGAAPGAIGGPGGPGGPGGGFGGRGGGAGAAANAGPTITPLQVMNRLIDMGVDVNHELTRKRPYTNGRQRFTDYDMRDGVAPLFLSVIGNDQESLELLLKHGAEVELPNVFQMTPLMYAAGMRGTGRNEICGVAADSARNLRMVDTLIAAGADINRQVIGSRNRTGTLMAYVAGCDQEGRDALMNAANAGSETTVKELLQRGANPQQRDVEGRTALDFARAPPPKNYPEGAQKERLIKGRAASAELLEVAMARSATTSTAAPAR